MRNLLVVIALAALALISGGCGSAVTPASSTASVSTTRADRDGIPPQRALDYRLADRLMQETAAKRLCRRGSPLAMYSPMRVQRAVKRVLGEKIREAGGRPLSVSVIFAAKCQLRALGSN